MSAKDWFFKQESASSKLIILIENIFSAILSDPKERFGHFVAFVKINKIYFPLSHQKSSAEYNLNIHR
jgi:hypothetical protein